MQEMLHDLVGHEVEVWSLDGVTHYGLRDVGILEAYDEKFIRLRSNDNVLLYFSFHNIRLIKLSE